jgi:hypothetical protein
MRAAIYQVKGRKMIGGEYRGEGTFTVLVVDEVPPRSLETITGREHGVIEKCGAALGPGWTVDEIQLIEDITRPRSFRLDTLRVGVLS